MSNTDVLSPEQTAALARARSMNARPFVERPPEIKLYNTMMKVADSNPGEFFIKRYNPEKQADDILPIGPSPEVVLMHKANTYSYYSEKLNRLVAWTSDIVSFTDGKVYLFKNDGKSSFCEKQGSYREVKAYMEEKYVQKDPDSGETLKNLMTFNTTLYVLHGGTDPVKNLFRIFVSNAGAAGLAPDTGKPDFKRPQPGSLIEFLKPIQFAGSAMFEKTCRLSAEYVDGPRQFWLMKFTDAGDTKDLGAVVEAHGKVMNMWAAMQKADIERMTVKELAKDDGVIEADVVTADQLPNFN